MVTYHFEYITLPQVMAMVEDQKEDQWWDLGPEGIPWERYPGVVTWDIDFLLE